MESSITETGNPMAKQRKKYNPKSKPAKAPKGGKLAAKIRILKKEGYSQKQAVAIAHNLKRKKKL